MRISHQFLISWVFAESSPFCEPSATESSPVEPSTTESSPAHLLRPCIYVCEFYSLNTCSQWYPSSTWELFSCECFLSRFASFTYVLLSVTLKISLDILLCFALDAILHRILQTEDFPDFCRYFPVVLVAARYQYKACALAWFLGGLWLWVLARRAFALVPHIFPWMTKTKPSQAKPSQGCECGWRVSKNQ